jgi:hypothetical protein
MNFGEMAWRPRLRQIGFAPKGEEWRCFQPGLNTRPGEYYSEDITLSLAERWHMFLGYREHDARELLKEFDVYQIVHLDDLFRFVLHLPKPLGQLLDEAKIPRTKTLTHFNPLFGPPPEFHGPLEPSGLLPYGAKTGNDKELGVQPSFRHIENLPIFSMPSVESRDKVLALLAVHTHKQQ